MKKTFLFVITLVVLSNCQSQNSRLDELQALFQHNEINSLLDHQTVVVIPNAGCKGCITVAENFVKNNIDSLKDIRYVFTGIKSSKLLKFKMSEYVFRHQNVYLDLEGHLYNSGQIGLYPLIISITDGKITSVIEQSPDNPDAFKILLSKQLLSNIKQINYD